MKIKPIVEGHGEIQAVPVLLRRLLAESEIFDLEVANPIRQKRSELVLEDKLKRAIRLALLDQECAAILVLFDGDDDCPKELAPQLQAWAEQEAGSTPCQVVIANREYEAWFLAAIESLRGKREINLTAEPPANPEAIRGAKERITKFMPSGRAYNEVTDQASLTQSFDFPTAYQRSRSFRKLIKAYSMLVRGAGAQLDAWPPAAWEEIAPSA